MKNFYKLLAITVLVAVTGFSFTACSKILTVAVKKAVELAAGGDSTKGGQKQNDAAKAKDDSKASGTKNSSAKSGGGFSGNGATSRGGVFTLTGIPSKYNGKYVLSTYSITGEVDPITGFQSYNSSSEKLTNMTFPIVSNGKVSIPQWKKDENNFRFTRYSGNVTSSITVLIHTIQTANEDNFDKLADNTEAVVLFDSVVFSKGSASRSWSKADEIYPPE